MKKICRCSLTNKLKMASMFSSYSAVGFYRTPITKCLLCSMFVSTFSLNAVPQLSMLRRYFLCDVLDIFEGGKFGSFVCCRSTFLDVKDLICGALLLYYFRVFERRLGSHKFASFLLTTGATAALLELFVLGAMRAIHVDIFSGSLRYLSCGPYQFIFPLFVNYFFDVPQGAPTHVMGVPVTGKTLTYLLGLQMALSSPGSVIPACCCLVSGLAYRYNILNIQSWFRVPDFVARFCAATVGRVAASSPPPDGLPMGATLEIQRSQQLELLEHQMLFSRVRDGRHFGQLYDNIANGNNFPNYDGMATLRRGNLTNNYDEAIVNDGNSMAEEASVVIEDQVQRLIEMGFERSKVVTALRTSNNDVNTATSILLRDS